MIRLSCPIKHDLLTENPHVLKIHYDNPSEKNNYTGLLKRIQGKSIIESKFGKVSLVGKQDSVEDKEIVLIYPKSSILRRYFRPGANSNTLLLTEECDQRCIMCSQPPKNKRYDNFNLYKQATLLMPQNSTLGISGGEPTLLKKTIVQFFDRDNR